MSRWDWAGKKVLVTGGAGAIGANLVARLAEKHRCAVTVVDDFSQGRISNLRGCMGSGSVTLIQGDINQPKILQAAFRKKIEIVYHLAASFANELSVEEPLHDLECNIKGTLNLLLKSAHSGVKTFVYASSSSIYGPRAETRLRESLFPNPSTPYAVSKLTGEFYCNSMHHLYNLNTVALRFSNTYGPKDFPGRYRNVIPNFLACALQNRPLKITGTGNETRDYTYIDDCIDGILLATQSPKARNRIFNLGTGKATKTIVLAKTILKITRSKSKIEFVPPRYFDHIPKRWMDVSQAKVAFGYNPQTALTDGVRKTYEWFLSNRKEAIESYGR